MITAATAVGAWLGSKLLDKGFDEAYQLVTTSDIINKKFKSAIGVVSRKLQQENPDILDGSIEYFFKSEKVFTELFKLLFKSSKIDIKIIEANFDTLTLPKDFIKSFIEALKVELLRDPVFDRILSDNEIYILFQGVDKNVKSIAENTLLTAKGVKELQELIANKLNDNFDFEEFKDIYKKNAINTLSQINFLGLGIDSSKKINRKNLQDIFVRPLFQPLGKVKHSTKNAADYYDDNDDESVVEYKNILSCSNRIVILGNPGAGKSLLIKSLMCDILSNNSSTFEEADILEYLPFRIELRKYIGFKKENKASILKFILSTIESEYQINSLTESALNEIFLKHKCIVFFDGLDEIFNVNDKVSTKTDIENFSNRYQTLKSVTTSRIIGYEETSLNESFQELIIKKFNEEQIDDYVKNWYEKEEDNVVIREREIEGFLDKKHEIDNELIANPLLLSLIVIIYRNALKLPESKLEIYQSCTKTLVDKWEAIKELKFDIDPELFKNKDKLLADLAYWQYQRLSGTSPEITYEKARRTIAESLIRLEIADAFESENLAEEFMNYASKRSIYFEDNFTHKTFLEYYTAYWIYSNVEKVHDIKKRNEIITKYIANPFWNIVLELLFNLIDKDLGTNSIIDKIVDEQVTKSVKSLPFLLSICLKLKNISKTRISKIIQKSIINVLNGYGKKTEIESKVFPALELLYYQNTLGRTWITNQFKALENDYENNPRNLLKLYTLYIELHLSYRSPKEFQFQLSNRQAFDNLVNNNDFLFIINTYAFHYDIMLERFLEFITIFNVSNVFKSYEAKFERYRFGPFIDNMLYSLLYDGNAVFVVSYLYKCDDLGLSFNQITSHLIKKGRSNHASLEPQRRAINLLNQIEDLQTIKLLLVYLYSVGGYPRTTYKNIIKGNKFEKILNRIFSRLDYKELEQFILNFTGVESIEEM